jgi:putative FmdB family regulatory protein
MPTYDYQCDACDHTLEIFHSIKDAPKRKCPACGRMKLRRLLGSGAAVVFKGSGFYQTDYRSESYKKQAAADKPDSSSSSSSSSSSESSKPAAGSESKSTESKKSTDKS